MYSNYWKSCLHFFAPHEMKKMDPNVREIYSSTKFTKYYYLLFYN